jgi:hypothetical protein
MVLMVADQRVPLQAIEEAFSELFPLEPDEPAPAPPPEPEPEPAVPEPLAAPKGGKPKTPPAGKAKTPPGGKGKGKKEPEPEPEPEPEVEAEPEPVEPEEPVQLDEYETRKLAFDDKVRLA